MGIPADGEEEDHLCLEPRIVMSKVRKVGTRTRHPLGANWAAGDLISHVEKIMGYEIYLFLCCVRFIYEF